MSCARGTIIGLLLVAVAVGLTGCYTPAARWGDDGVDKRTVELPTSTPKALRAFYDGFQRCGADYGVADCTPADEDGRAASEQRSADRPSSVRSLRVMHALQRTSKPRLSVSIHHVLRIDIRE
jgi:hypothetical protein